MRVPEYGGAKVAQSGGATPLLQSAMPAGASVASVLGQGLEQVGASVSGAGEAFHQQAISLQTLNNKASADEAVIANAKRANAITADVMTKQRKAAVDAVPGAYAALEDARTEVKQTLANPEAQSLYDQQTRPQLAYQMSALSQHAATEAKRWRTGTAENNMLLASEDASRVAGDPKAFAAAMKTLETNVGVWGVQADASPEDVAVKMLQVKSGVYKNVAEGMITTSASGSRDYIEGHRADMTADDYQSVYRSAYSIGKVQDAAMIADNLFSGRGYSAPTADLDVGAVHANPKAFLSSKLGFDVTINSGYRSPAHNAQVAGASKTSEHLTDRAYDIDIPQGMTGKQVIDKFKASGLPYDELFDEGDHVHWGYDSKFRGKEGVKDAKGNIVITARKPQNNTTITVPPISPDTVEEDLPGIVQSARTEALRQRPGDLVFADSVEDQVRAKAGRVAHDYTAKITAAQDDLLTTALNGPDGLPYDSPDAMLKAHPELTGPWQMLKPKQQLAFARSLRTEANVMSPGRLANEDMLNGLALHEPQKFLTTDIVAADLTNGQKRAFLGKKAAILKKQMAISESGTQVNHALGLKPVSSGLKDAGIEFGTPEYNQFSGAFIAEIDRAKAATGGKNPKDDELINMAGKLISQTKRGWSGNYDSGPRAFEAPSKFSGDFTAQYQNQYGAAPTPADIAYAYRNWKAANPNKEYN